MGPKIVERRVKTVRRLFHPLPVKWCAMLIYDDAYFRFPHFTIIFFGARSAENFYSSIVFDTKKCAMLKNCTTLIQFLPSQEVCDAYLRRRQFRIDE